MSYCRKISLTTLVTILSSALMAEGKIVSTIPTINSAWVKEFRIRAAFLLEKTKSSGEKSNKPYAYPQPDLALLEKTGYGDCVAWSKLMAKIAIKRKLKFVHHIIIENTNEDRPKQTHQVTIIISDEQDKWLQSYAHLERIVNMNEALKKIADDMEFKNGCRSLVEFTVEEKDLY